ncbi:MAG: amidohydrolase family protein [Bacteroidetes bacterium]|nr:amidohydrolase family protein [Bacteroidota bacterium]
MILLKNGTYINWQTLEFREADILVEEGAQGNLVFSPTEGHPVPSKVIDCTGKYITHSFANGHHHVYSALAMGMNPPRKNPENFLEILQYIWWNLDKALDLEMIRSSALVTAIACAKNGITFVVDHHASPFAVAGSLETIARAFDEAGVGHLLCYEISDRDGLDSARKGLLETEHYLRHRQGLVGLHASFTVSDDTLERAVDLAIRTDSGIHMHVAEDNSDELHCLEHYGMRIMNRLDQAGALQFPKTILAHCLHLDQAERKIVAQSSAWIVQNTESNLNNGVGHFSSSGLGPNIMLGTDGMHSDMLRSAKAAFFAGQEYDSIDSYETYRRFRNVHHYLSRNELTGDGENNLVILDYDSPTPFNQSNFPGHFLFGIESKNVRHVISGGKLIVEDGQMLTLNEPEILAEAQKQAERLWAKMK